MQCLSLSLWLLVTKRIQPFFVISISVLNNIETSLEAFLFPKFWICLKVQLYFLQSQKAHQVIQLHITCWKPDGQCSNLKAVVDSIDEVAKIQRRTGNKPIFVHCRYN